MEIHVYDTYVKAADGHTMHFDVITGEKDHPKAIEYGKEWLKEIGEGEAQMTQNECTFCHSIFGLDLLTLQSQINQGMFKYLWV